MILTVFSHFTYRQIFSGYLMISVHSTIFHKLFIQFIYGRYVRDRHEEISSDKSYQTFYKPLFMPLCRIAEYWFEGIMCRQGKIFVCCFCMTSKSFFYSNTSIIKNDLLRRSAKMFKSFYDPFQKAFFILPVKSGNKDIPAVAFTHTPYLDFLPDPAKYYSCLTPIHLNGFGWVIGQWHKHIAHLAFEFCHRPSYRSFTAIKTTFGNQACVYLMCCMLLLPRRFLIRIQALHDKCFDFIGDDVIFSAAARFAFPWNCSSFPVFLYCVS